MSRKSRLNEQKQQYVQEAQDKMTRKRIILIGVSILVLIAVLAAGIPILIDRDPGKVADQMEANRTEGVTPVASDWIQIDVENYGSITAELYSNVAPITVSNFMKLVDEGFYDGLTFHRIIDGLMIQGGDPLGTGTGGSPDTIKGEFTSNGWRNDLKHDRGVLSMARTSVPDSASSQFFIVQQDSHHLDGSYAAFGKVLTGMDVVDAICKNTPTSGGIAAKENQPVITAIKRIEKPAE